MKKLNSNLAQSALQGNIHDGKRARKYDLYGGKHNKDDFIKKMTKEIEENLPEVNISDIVDQYYNRSTRNGQAVESNLIIFQKTLEQEKKKYFELK